MSTEEIMKKAIRLAIFKGRQTEPELILCAVRWTLRYSLARRPISLPKPENST